MKKQSYKIKIKFNESNKSKFNNVLKNVDWGDLYPCTYKQTSFTYFNKTSLWHFNNCFPIEKTKITCTNRNEWLTNSIIRSIQEKQSYL